LRHSEQKHHTDRFVLIAEGNRAAYTDHRQHVDIDRPDADRGESAGRREDAASDRPADPETLAITGSCSIPATATTHIATRAAVMGRPLTRIEESETSGLSCASHTALRSGRPHRPSRTS